MARALPALLSQRRSSPCPASRFVERGVRAIEFHLMDDAQQFAETAFRKTFHREVLQVFRGQIVNRHTARRKIPGAETTERHVHAFDLRKLGGHFGTQVFLHRCTVANTNVNASATANKAVNNPIVAPGDCVAPIRSAMLPPFQKTP